MRQVPRAFGPRRRTRPLVAQITSAEQPGRLLDERRRQLRETREDLVVAYTKAGIDGSLDLNSADRAFDELAKRAEEDQRAIAAADAAQQALRAALGDDTIERLEQRVGQAEGDHRQSVARHGTLSSEPGDADELRRGCEKLEHELRLVNLEVAELGAKIEDRESRLIVPAELHVAIAGLDEQIGNLARLANAIRIAREELAESAREARQEFAPHLNAALVHNLPRVTRGRYRDATVSDDLRIKVAAPETGQAWTSSSSAGARATRST